MKITSGTADIDIELQDLNVDKTFTYWDGKKYAKVSHTVLPRSSFLLGICGRAGCGKSTLISSILCSSSKNSRVYRGVFSHIYFIMKKQNMSSFKNSPFGEIDDSQIYPNFDLETLNEIWELVKQNKLNNENSLLVVDDQISGTRSHENFFHDMCLQHRHYNFSAIIGYQDQKFLSPILRNNLSGLVIFRNENKKRLEILHNEFLSHLNVSEFQKLMSYIFDKHGNTLYIDLKSHPMKLYKNFSLLNITGYDSEHIE